MLSLDCQLVMIHEDALVNTKHVIMLHEGIEGRVWVWVVSHEGVWWLQCAHELKKMHNVFSRVCVGVLK